MLLLETIFTLHIQPLEMNFTIKTTNLTKITICRQAATSFKYVQH